MMLQSNRELWSYIAGSQYRLCSDSLNFTLHDWFRDIFVQIKHPDQCMILISQKLLWTQRLTNTWLLQLEFWQAKGAGQDPGPGHPAGQGEESHRHILRPHGDACSVSTCVFFVCVCVCLFLLGPHVWKLFALQPGKIRVKKTNNNKSYISDRFFFLDPPHTHTHLSFPLPILVV